MKNNEKSGKPKKHIRNMIKKGPQNKTNKSIIDSFYWFYSFFVVDFRLSFIITPYSMNSLFGEFFTEFFQWLLVRFLARFFDQFLARLLTVFLGGQKIQCTFLLGQ